MYARTLAAPLRCSVGATTALWKDLIERGRDMIQRRAVLRFLHKQRLPDDLIVGDRQRYPAKLGHAPRCGEQSLANVLGFKYPSVELG